MLQILTLELKSVLMFQIYYEVYMKQEQRLKVDGAGCYQEIVMM